MTDFIKVTHNGGVKYLKRAAKASGCNGMSFSTDRTGHPLITVGYDTKPDSDWGKWTCHYIVHCKTAELYQSAVNALCDVFGWDDREAIILGEFKPEAIKEAQS